MRKIQNKEIPDYPSLELAFEFVKPSYDWIMNWFEITNNKIQSLLTLAVTLTAALPLFAIAIFQEINFKSNWFYISLGCFLALMIAGVIGRRIGAVKLLHPRLLYNQTLQYSKFEFKRNLLYWAGEHFNINKKYIFIKNLILDIMTGLLLLEIVFIVVWIIMQN